MRKTTCWFLQTSPAISEVIIIFILIYAWKSSNHAAHNAIQEILTGRIQQSRVGRVEKYKHKGRKKSKTISLHNAGFFTQVNTFLPVTVLKYILDRFYFKNTRYLWVNHFLSKILQRSFSFPSVTMHLFSKSN